MPGQQPDPKLSAGDEQVVDYLQEVEKAHSELLRTSTERWVERFCNAVREYLLDLEYGPETAEDTKWIHDRRELLGSERAHSKGTEKRWRKLRDEATGGAMTLRDIRQIKHDIMQINVADDEGRASAPKIDRPALAGRFQAVATSVGVAWKWNWRDYVAAVNSAMPQDVVARVFSAVQRVRAANRWKSMISTNANCPYTSVLLTDASIGDHGVRQGDHAVARWNREQETQEVKDLLLEYEQAVASAPMAEQMAEQMAEPPLKDAHKRAGFSEPLTWESIWKLIRKDKDGKMKQWLKSQTLSLYIEMMNARNATMLATKNYNATKPLLNTHFFDSQFYTRITEGRGGVGYDFVASAPVTNSENKRRGDIFERDMAFVVVNLDDTHWTLVVVNFVDKRMEYFDGRNGAEGESILNTMRRWLKDEKIRLTNGEAKWDDRDWTYHAWSAAQGRPTQFDDYNCGVIALQIANYYAQNGTLNFDKNEWNNFRLQMLSEFIHAKLFDEGDSLELHPAPVQNPEENGEALPDGREQAASVPTSEVTKLLQEALELSNRYEERLSKVSNGLLLQWRDERTNAKAALELQGNSDEAKQEALLALRGRNGAVEDEYAGVLRDFVPPRADRVRRHINAPERFVSPPEGQFLRGRERARPRDRL